jgi:hypothetical protein
MACTRNQCRTPNPKAPTNEQIHCAIPLWIKCVVEGFEELVPVPLQLRAEEHLNVTANLSEITPPCSRRRLPEEILLNALERPIAQRYSFGNAVERCSNLELACRNTRFTVVQLSERWRLDPISGLNAPFKDK